MSRIELIAPCHFGLESVLKKEILDLGYEIVQVEEEELHLQEKKMRLQEQICLFVQLNVS